MSTTILAVHLFASMIALIASYAAVMSVLKKEINMTWLRGESLLTLGAAAVSIASGMQALIESDSVLWTVAMILLIFGFGNMLAFFGIQYRSIMLQDVPASDTVRPLSKVVALCAFVALLLHVLIQFAAVAGF